MKWRSKVTMTILLVKKWHVRLHIPTFFVYARALCGLLHFYFSIR